MIYFIVVTVAFSILSTTCTALLFPQSIGFRRYRISCDLMETQSETFLSQDYGDASAEIDYDHLDTLEVKDKLLDLLPRMTGTQEEFRQVELLVNLLEERFSPVQTLEFFNMATSGEWQLLFSTNISSRSKQNFRLREMCQRVESNSAASLEGIMSNEVTWELAQDGGLIFDARGTFSVLCNYKIEQGSRQNLKLEDSILKLAKGSTLPDDIEKLVGLLNRAMPNELFDPSEHAIDTTYLDGQLRITRMTGPRFEGVRDIYIRKGSIEIDPSKK